jgi:DNA-binding response OmpR family regulator
MIKREWCIVQKIYIADDEKNIRDLIYGFLTNDGFEVKAFENGDDLLAEFLRCPSDMVILDIMMDGTDGLTICSEIRSRHNVPIIIVSARDSELDRITGFTLGGDDYLVKPFSSIELVARVKAIFRRINLDQTMNSKSTLAFGDITLNVSVRECMAGGKRIELTPTEFALLTYLFEHNDRAISRSELLKNVWKFDFEVDSRATDDVLKRLRKKIAGTGVLIESVWGYGFKLKLGDKA